ncbi:MAG: hypothetical protein EXQ99_06140 [Alphaproteobacteria bacterium]|nr:hypothetical protein [Alphaproteobacteria bacterium]
MDYGQNTMIDPEARLTMFAAWRHYYVRVAMAPDRDASDYRHGLETLRRIEAWLAANHRPIALFDAHGRPKSEAVSVFFDRTDAAKALAYRTLCNELGLAASLLSNLVVHVRCPRTTPPA